MDGNNLNFVLEQVGRDKGIEREVLIEALEAAMVTAARKKLGLSSDVEARYNDETGEVEIFEFRTIVKEVHNRSTEISFEDALKMDPDLGEEDVGEDLGVKIDSEEFGRIAAQTAKQVIIQRVREAERAQTFGEYKDRKGELVTGIVRRFERGNIIVDLGRAEAVLPTREQVQRENYRAGERIQAYVVDVLEIAKGAQIVLSRTHTGVLIKLFEQEVPEISEGVVSIEAAAREPGVRAKIAVSSRDYDVDPVGACVGMKGSRVQAVVQELRGEKIDIVSYEEDEATLVCNALSPAEVSRVLIDDKNHSMEIVVPDDQLSLAIGRRGQNVRLASQLTGWKIDITSETKVNEDRQQAWKSLSYLEGENGPISDFVIQTLFNSGFTSAESVMNADPEALAELPGFSPEAVAHIQASGVKAMEKELESASAEHLKAREDARTLALIDKLADEELQRAGSEDARMRELRGFQDDVIEALHAAGYDSLEDIYFEIEDVRLVRICKFTLEKATALRFVVAEKIKELTGGLAENRFAEPTEKEWEALEAHDAERIAALQAEAAADDEDDNGDDATAAQADGGVA